MIPHTHTHAHTYAHHLVSKRIVSLAMFLSTSNLAIFTPHTVKKKIYNLKLSVKSKLQTWRTNNKSGIDQIKKQLFQCGIQNRIHNSIEYFGCHLGGHWIIELPILEIKFANEKNIKNNFFVCFFKNCCSVQSILYLPGALFLLYSI